MDFRLGHFGDARLSRSGEFLHRQLASSGGRGVSVRRLGKDRAGEMRIGRFLRNDAVSIAEMVETASACTREKVTDRHVLAIQDTTTVRSDHAGRSLALHPVLGVDALDGAVLGLVDAELFSREGGKKAARKATEFEAKESRRWLDGAASAASLLEAGARCVTVIADREGDIYEDFACKPEGVEMLIRAGQNRRLADGGRLIERARDLPEMGRDTVHLPARPGRKARTATLALKAGEVTVQRPSSRKTGAEVDALPESVTLTLVEAREIDPPSQSEAIHWYLLTTHKIADLADIRRIIGFYRCRWTIEQLFRTLKTKGFDVEAATLTRGGPFETLVAACLIAAVTVLQLVHERDGTAQRPIEDTIHPQDRPVLEALCPTLEGKTLKQQNPHPPSSLAWAAWIFARLGGWNCYYGKPGPIVMLRGIVEFHAIKHGWKLRDV